MAYSSIVEMASSFSLISRVAAAAASEGVADAITWANGNIWRVVAENEEWATNWGYAVDTATINVNPDTGARTDVISDQMILAVVQPMVLGTPSEA
jgi:uncharacterized protein YjiK